MTKYAMNEGYFDLPSRGFVDRTVHVFEASLGGDDELGLLVCRTPIPPGRTLRDVVIEHVKHEAKRLAGYAILEERELRWADSPAIEVLGRFRHEGRVVYQRQAHLAALGTWMLFAVSAPFEHRELADTSLDQVLETLVLREPKADG
jgi:hypothetical protein